MPFAFKKLALSVLLVAALIATGVGIAGWLYVTRPLPQRLTVTKPPPLVEVQRVEPEDIREYFTGYGSARVYREVQLSSEVSGVIVEVTAGLKDGSPVDEGQLLVRIDDREYQQQLVRAQSLAASYEAQILGLDIEQTNLKKLAATARQEVSINFNEFQRLSNLFEVDQASRKEYDFARLAHNRSRRVLQEYENQLAQIEPRRAALAASRDAHHAGAAIAQLNVERCRLRAPFSGQIDTMAIDVGDRVQPGSSILRLVSTGIVEVPLELPISARMSVAVGAACHLEVENARGVAWEGRISRISPVADTQSRTFSIYVEVDNDRQETPLVPGQFVWATVEGPLLRQVMAVPRGAIVDDLVYVANDGVAHARTVEIVKLIGERAIVSGSLNGGEAVILTNLDILFDGAPVRLADVEADESVEGLAGQDQAEIEEPVQ